MHVTSPFQLITSGSQIYEVTPKNYDVFRQIYRKEERGQSHASRVRSSCKETLRKHKLTRINSSASIQEYTDDLFIVGNTSIHFILLFQSLMYVSFFGISDNHTTCWNMMVNSTFFFAQFFCNTLYWPLPCWGLTDSIWNRLPRYRRWWVSHCSNPTVCIWNISGLRATSHERSRDRGVRCHRLSDQLWYSLR